MGSPILDWHNFRPLDLSDEELLADLAEDEPEVAEMLALDVPRDTSAEYRRRSSDR